MQRRLAAYAPTRADNRWLVGFGWNQELWADKSFPTAADLDKVVSDRPVVLERVDGHAIVVNSAALKAAGITAATQAPEGGRSSATRAGIRRACSSTTREAWSNARYRPALPPNRTRRSPRRRKASVGRCDVGRLDEYVGERLAGIPARRECGPAAGSADVLHDRDRRRGHGSAPDRLVVWRPLRLVGVKLFADGALGSRGAWLKQPYADKPDTRGIPRHSDADLLSQADAAAARGFQIATHAIGDAANAQVISHL